MEELLKVAKKILDLNEDAALTGSLMLKIRGIDLGRDLHDIDIVTKNIENIVFPNEFVIENTGTSSNGFSTRCKYNDIVIDVLSSDEEYEIHNGWRLGTVEKLMQRKYEYSKQNNENAKKHYEDLVKLEFNFPA